MTISEITEYMFIADEDLRGDLAIVFGVWNAWQESVEKAAQLFKDKLVSKFIVSGGKNPSSGLIEGDLMAASLEKLGVPRKNIYIENKSLNTLENVLFSKFVIEKQIGIENVKTIVAVVRNFHARRALMTLRKHFPARINFKIASYDSIYYGFNQNNWSQSAIGKQKVTEEMEKIQKYLKKGDIAEI